MCVTDGRNETLGDTALPVPRQAMSRALTHQRVSPNATNFATHSCQTIQIDRHSLLVEIPLTFVIPGGNTEITPSGSSIGYEIGLKHSF